LVNCQSNNWTGTSKVNIRKSGGETVGKSKERRAFMRKFLRRSWHGIPLGLVLTFIIVGAAVAATTFLSGTFEIEVKEPCSVQIWDGTNWVTQDNDFAIDLGGVYPGEEIKVPLRVSNDSSATLTVTGIYTMSLYPTNGYGDITVTGGFSGGVSCPSGITRDDLTFTVKNDAPAGDYSFTVNFSRG